MSQIRVMITDDHLIVRDGLRLILETTDGIEIVGEASDGAECLRLVPELKPDVIVSLWEGTNEEAAPYLEDYVVAEIGDRIDVFLRKDSPNVLWDKVAIRN